MASYKFAFHRLKLMF